MIFSFAERREVVGVRERRELARHAEAGRLVARGADPRERALAHLEHRVAVGLDRRRDDRCTAVREVGLLRRHQLVALRAVDAQLADRALVERAEQRVIDERVRARHVDA